mgnify:FL=1
MPPARTLAICPATFAPTACISRWFWESASWPSFSMTRADMGKAKSKILTFGEVGFRLSTSVSLPRAKEKIEEIIRRLKNRQMMDCIVVKEDVSKEALKKYGEDTVNAVGATWKQQDVFGYELDFAKLEQVKSGM